MRELSDEIFLRVMKPDECPTTVHVLGAGFSHVAGLPLCKDLFREIDYFIQKEYTATFIKRHGRGSAEFILEILISQWEELRHKIMTSEIFRGLFLFDSQGYIDANIENLLNAVDDEIEAAKQQARGDSETIFTLWRFTLVNCLAYYIRWVTPKLIEENVTSVVPLIKYICNFVKPGDSIISFNYDDIVEQVLLEAKEIAPNSRILWHYGDGYGFDLPVYHLFSSSDLIIPISTSKGSNVKLLNLHGSAKWTWDNKESRVIFDNSLGFYGMRKTLNGMDHIRRPLIAEPRKNKPLGIGPLKEIWNAAEKALHTADQIIIIGYSLPDADSAAEKLILSSLTNTNAELIVIDPLPIADHRIVSLFGERVFYYQSSLQAFLQSIEDKLLVDKGDSLET